ncbi:MAG: flippase-like domain-containing protein [Deltaproteobacteria bacterium]|nr:flippase-like domain-containing protein [Deltaproteobacteria bacterium]
MMRMASFWRTHLNFLIGLIISAAAVYLSLRKIDFHALWASLRSVNYVFLFPAVAGQISCFFLKGNGWRYLLTPAKKSISVTSATIVLIIGLMVNNLFPAKMGELARGYLMGERERLPKTLCLSTVAVEHLLDILILTIFFLLLLPSVSLPPWLQTSGTLVGFIALGMILVLFLVARREEKFLGFVNKLLSRFPDRFASKIQSILNNIFQGMRVLTGRYIFYAFAALSSMWVMAFLVAYLVLAACGLFLPFQTAIMVVVFAAFGKIIPSSPGAIGTFHYVVILVLMSFEVSKEIALGYAIVLHALSFLIETSLGVSLVFAGNLSFRRIAHRPEESL